MRGLVVSVLLVAGSLSCGSPTPTQTQTPSPTSATDLPTLPLPEGLSGIPGLDEFGISIDAITPPGSVPVGSEQAFTLGHCGLSSPIDIDGSLWDPVAGEGAAGGPLTETNTGELINSTAVLLVLVDAQTMLMATPAGARILLERHNGPRFYRGCD